MLRSSCAGASAQAKAAVRGHMGLQETNLPNAAANCRTVLSMTRRVEEQGQEQGEQWRQESAV